MFATVTQLYETETTNVASENISRLHFVQLQYDPTQAYYETSDSAAGLVVII
jgi:hypothetical protein